MKKKKSIILYDAVDHRDFKPSKKSKGKFGAKSDYKRRTTEPRAFVTSSRALDYWTGAVAQALNVGEEGITVLKYPVQNIPKNIRRKMELDDDGSRDAMPLRAKTRLRPAYEITRTLGGKRRRNK